VYLLNLNGVSRVTVSDCQFIGYVGDGIYLGSSNVLGLERHNDNVTISNCVFDGVTKNNRNGISIIDGTDITIDGCSFTRTGRADMPAAIDIEPNPETDAFTRIQRITINHCTFSDIGASCFVSVVLSPNDVLGHPADTISVINCQGTTTGSYPQFGVLVRQINSQVNSASATTPPLNFSAVGCTFDGVQYPFVVFGTRGVRFESCTFTNSQQYAYLGAFDGTRRNRDVVVTACTFKYIGLNTSGRIGLSVFGNDYVKIDTCRFEDCGAGDGSGGEAIWFGGNNARSSYVDLTSNTIASPLRRTSYGITVATTHALTPSTNTQVGTVLSGVSGNQFLPVSS
jgi:hypothetical protein